jgi:hypothetical protein
MRVEVTIDITAAPGRVWAVLIELLALVWRVTDFRPGQALTWEAKSWGAVTVAEQTIIRD